LCGGLSGKLVHANVNDRHELWDQEVKFAMKFLSTGGRLEPRELLIHNTGQAGEGRAKRHRIIAEPGQ
jgi:hypothetical protein